MGFGSADNHQYIANGTNQDVYVVPVPNKDWTWNDASFSVQTSLVTLDGDVATAKNNVSS